MLRYVLRRLLQAVPVLLVVSLLSFGLMAYAPGDFLSRAMADPSISDERLESMRRSFGLDRPWLERYGRWLGNTLRGDFGVSLAYPNRPVLALIGERTGKTLLLTAASTAFAWLVALPLGAAAAVWRGRWPDQLVGAVSALGLAIPSMLSALLLVLMAAATGWFPIGGMRSANHDSLDALGRALDVGHHLILPAVAMAIPSIAMLARHFRSHLVDSLGADFVRTAHAKGLPARTVVLKHALRHAVNPLITLFSLDLAGLLSSSFVVESILAWPGLGNLTYEALLAQDVFLVMAALMLSAVMLIAGTLVGDLLLAAVDPRVRLE